MLSYPINKSQQQVVSSAVAGGLRFLEKSRRIRVARLEKNPDAFSTLLFEGDYTTQLYRDVNNPL